MKVDIKTLILALVSIFAINFVASNAFALPDLESEIQTAQVDELELEHEVETLEAYGEAAGSQQEKEEVARLQSEKKSLEKKVKSLRSQNEVARKKAVRLAQSYREKEKAALKVKRKADQVEKEHNRLATQNNRLAARVEAAEQKVIA